MIDLTMYRMNTLFCVIVTDALLHKSFNHLTAVATSRGGVAIYMWAMKETSKVI